MLWQKGSHNSHIWMSGGNSEDNAPQYNLCFHEERLSVIFQFTNIYVLLRHRKKDRVLKKCDYIKTKTMTKAWSELLTEVNGDS